MPTIPDRVKWLFAAVAELAEVAREAFLNQALSRFDEDAEKAEFITLRYFAGLSEQEATDMLGISRSIASHHCKFARSRLIQAMKLD